MTEEKKDQPLKKSEEQIMFPNQEIAGFTVKPWSFGKLFEISPKLEKLLNEMDEKNIDLMGEIDSGVLKYATILKVFNAVGPGLLEIISLTVGVPEDEVREVSVEDGVALIMAIFSQNSETIKNALRLQGILLPEKPENEEDEPKA